MVGAGLMLMAPSGMAVMAARSTSTTATTTASQTAAQQQRLATIKNRGCAEINRRLTQLNRLDSLINAATHISASDKATLIGQVANEVSGLQQLEATLNSETTLAAAIADAQNIILGYRVYALVTPKVHIIKVADDEQVTETNLITLTTKLQDRITTAQSQGKNVATLQSQLNDLTTQAKNAQAISSTIEASVIGLQPTDYNSNHAVLSGDAGQLQTAHIDNQAALKDAKTMVTELRSLQPNS